MAQKTNPQMEDLLSTTFQNRYESQFALENYLSILGSLPNLCAAWVGGHAAFEENRWYDWTPTFTGFSSNPSNPETTFTIINRTCFLRVYMMTTGTSNATGFTMTAPVPSGSNISLNSLAWYVDNGANTYGGGMAYLPNASQIITLYTTGGSAGWTNSGSKSASFELFYEI